MAILHVYQTNMTFVIVFLVSSEYTKKFCQQTFILYKVFVYLSVLSESKTHDFIVITTTSIPPPSSSLSCGVQGWGGGGGGESTSLLPTNQEVMKK